MVPNLRHWHSNVYCLYTSRLVDAWTFDWADDIPYTGLGWAAGVSSSWAGFGGFKCPWMVQLLPSPAPPHPPLPAPRTHCPCTPHPFYAFYSHTPPPPHAHCHILATHPIHCPPSPHSCIADCRCSYCPGTGTPGGLPLRTAAYILPTSPRLPPAQCHYNPTLLGGLVVAWCWVGVVGVVTVGIVPADLLTPAHALQTQPRATCHLPVGGRPDSGRWAGGLAGRWKAGGEQTCAVRTCHPPTWRWW